MQPHERRLRRFRMATRFTHQRSEGVRGSRCTIRRRRMRVPIGSIDSTQEWVNVGVLRAHAIGEQRKSDPVRVRIDGGRYVLLNGTHRYVVALLRGESELEVVVE